MFTEDLDAFFTLKSAGGLADPATLQGGATDGVPVLFDAAYMGQAGLAGTNPVALVQAAHVAAGDIGKTLTINGTAYTIRNREPQDDGATVLLQLDAP